MINATPAEGLVRGPAGGNASSREEAIAALEALGEHISAGLIVTGASGNVVHLNRTAELMLGWRAGDLLGRPCRRFIRCLDGDVVGRQSASCEPGEVATNGELVRRVLSTASGERLASNARSTRLFGPDGRVLGVVCTFNAGKRDGLLDRTGAEFLSNVSHELRTPLSSLATSIELLSSSYREMPADEVGNILQVVHHSTLQLRNLVENLLGASSIQLGCFHVQPRPGELEGVLEEAIAFILPVLEKKRQRLVKRIPPLLPQVLVDERRIVQVVVNLLANASKYGPPGDDIVLEASTRTRHATVSVSERGPGIAPDELRSIFDRFYRSRRNGLEGAQGVGLGLALVKSIVTAHGGRVGVESELGEGSTFWFTVPLAGKARKRPQQMEGGGESADR